MSGGRFSASPVQPSTWLVLRRTAMSLLPGFEHIRFGRKSGGFSETEKRILEKAKERMIVATDVNAALSAQESFGERLSDSIARVGGSWTFIISFAAFLVAWAVINTLILVGHAFDPYPFIFLNLLLSMLAAVQAPIIMMSQNRQAARDRFEAAKDFEINLKAEIEVLSLHHKIDMQVLAELAELRRDVARLTSLIEKSE